MIEKVNPSHPDKVADRIAGALVDLAYSKNERPKKETDMKLSTATEQYNLEKEKKTKATRQRSKMAKQVKELQLKKYNQY